jgi:hypothetical protein
LKKYGWAWWLHIRNPSSWESQAGRSRVQGQSEVHSNFQVSQDYILRPCPKKTLKNKRYIQFKKDTDIEKQLAQIENQKLYGHIRSNYINNYTKFI